MGRILACDFETTVYDGQETTEVWAAGMCELFTDNEPTIFNSFPSMFDTLVAMRCDMKLYFHNLKFDGSFWLDFLMRELKYTQAYYAVDEKTVRWMKKTKMPRRSFMYNISDKGQWYCITICTKYGKRIEIWDSLKLLPFSLESIGKSFRTPHQKLDMEYEGERHAGCIITEEEKKYLQNDVYVLKEALEIMFQEGHDKMTIGACCLSEFRHMFDREDYSRFFPNLYETDISSDLYGAGTAGEFIRNSYRGAWTYLVEEKANKIIQNGMTLDVNSLYPSMMHSSSGNKFPVGLPCFFTGDVPERAKGDNKYYFIKVKTSFRIKEGMLPTIQIKGDFRYCPTEFLKRSAVKIGDTYYEYERVSGRIKPVTVTFTLTETDWALIQDHYELYNTEIIGGCWFFAVRGIFDEYIDKYMEIKTTTKDPVQRQIAKLFLNNLYGKLASSPCSSFKLAYMDGEQIKFRTIHEELKVPGYIPGGSAITSYARNFTIRHAQKNYHGTDAPGFVYADTDSLHGDFTKEELIDIDLHDSAMQCWKLESKWDEALFVRQKTYIEHVTHEGEEKLEKPKFQITCAGMPDRCKGLLEVCLSGDISKKEHMKYWNEEFVAGHMWKGPQHLSMFQTGLEIPGKLMPKRIKGGIVLKNTAYKMHEKVRYVC